MPFVHACLLSLLSLALVAQETAISMRNRVFCDPESQTAFRFSYYYAIPDQYRGNLLRNEGGGEGVTTVVVPQGTPIKEILKRLEEARKKADHADVRHFSFKIAELPAGATANDLASVLKVVSDGKITSGQDWNYYQDPAARPHADPAWAPKDITGLVGTGSSHCGLALRHGDRISGLILLGSATAAENQALIRSFEILALPSKSATRARTWREEQTLAKSKVFDPTGRPVAASGAKAAKSWEQAWEIETAHYHISGTVAPSVLVNLGAYLEKLFTEYDAIFDPDRLPPYKAEIHITPTVRDFITLAGKHGFHGLADGSGGQLTGGFFAPRQLSIFTFTDPVPNFPTNVISVLAHEALHQFVHLACNGTSHVPTWVNEGLAVYFESCEFRDGRLTWRPPATRLEQLRQYYVQQKKVLTPVDTIIQHYGPIPALQYAEVYAFTHYWLFGSKEGHTRFRRFWQALRDGRNGTEAFKEIFLEELARIHGSAAAGLAVVEEQLVRYVNKGYTDKARPVYTK